MDKRLLGAGAAAAVFALAALAAHATSVRRMPVAEIGRRASVVAVGTVRGTSVRLATSPGGKTRIYTDYDLRDLSVWKGSVETRNLVLSVVGGNLHGAALKVDGMPRLEEGRRYLLFLGEAEPLCPAIGLCQGVFPLEESADGALLVHRYQGDAISGVSGGELVLGGPALRLEEFLAALDREGVRARPPAGEGR
jgi:hypothetical protein